LNTWLGRFRRYGRHGLSVTAKPAEGRTDFISNNIFAEPYYRRNEQRQPEGQKTATQNLGDSRPP